MKIIENLEQGSPDWIKARTGKITGTKMEKVMGSSLDRLMLACELIAEEATEQTKSFKVTPEMERGTAEEVFARKEFEKRTGKKVEQIGFCISDRFDYLGVSGDGWIKKGKKYTEAFENKSPDTKNSVFYQLESIFSAEELGLGTWSKPTKADPEPIFKPSAKAPFEGIPSDYKWQVITYFIVNEDLEKLHFSIYDSRFINEEPRLFLIELNRSDAAVAEAIEEAEKELVIFREFWLKLRNKIIKDNF